MVVVVAIVMAVEIAVVMKISGDEDLIGGVPYGHQFFEM